jgi:molybdopterin-guanine dinucleotide biosynthesis protein A
VVESGLEMEGLHYSDTLIKDVSGLILAGGESSRYGKNKALVHINGIPLIQRVSRVMQTLFQEVILITNTPDEYSFLNLPMYEDIIKGLGPLGGLFTGLTMMANDAGFLVGCDMPFLNRELIRHIVGIRDNCDVIVPKISGLMEPLHALYSKGCLPYLRKLIDSRKYQIFQFFSEVSVKYVDESFIRRFDPEIRCFYNINEPQQLNNIS